MVRYNNVAWKLPCRPPRGSHARAGGALFGAGWWVFGDALVYHSSMLGLPFSAIWLLPGLIATLAIIVMNTVSHEDVTGNGYGDESVTVGL